MRVAVFSDIHGNLEALEAVLATEVFRGAERSVCLGDVVGYGASPSECLGRTREVTDRILLGNHESAVIRPEEIAYFNGYARQAIEWTRDRLSETEREFLRTLPLAHREPPALLFVHSAPTAPEAWEYVYDAASAAREMAAFTETVCFVGHSHIPLALEVVEGGTGRLVPFPVSIKRGARYLVNAGSVGQPRDGDPRASFAVYDAEVRRVELVRVEYPVEKAQEKILAAELPAFLAARLARGR